MRISREEVIHDEAHLVPRKSINHCIHTHTYTHIKENYFSSQRNFLTRFMTTAATLPPSVVLSTYKVSLERWAERRRGRLVDLNHSIRKRPANASSAFKQLCAASFARVSPT